MRILWTKKAEKSLDKILQHTLEHFSSELAERIFFELKLAVAKLSEHPYLGRRIGGTEEKRQLIISGNTIIYEIVLISEPFILIRNIRPRGTNSQGNE